MKVVNSLTGRPIKYPRFNSEGKPILLPHALQQACDAAEDQARLMAKTSTLFNGQMVNAIGSPSGAIGFDIPITTMTTIIKEKSEQKFYDMLGKTPSDYVPFKVGQGAWSDFLLTYLVQKFADNLETGIIDMGSPSGRLAEATSGVKAVPVQTYTWAKQITWNMAQMNAAAKAGNWDLVSSLEESRKQDWDLGVQRWTFFGGRGLNGTNGTTYGLLNQPASRGVITNTTLITQKISSMNTTQFATFIQGLIDTYMVNTNYTTAPTHFVIPQDDYNGMATPLSPTFPVISVGEYLEKAIKQIVPTFKAVLPSAYAMPAYNSVVFGGGGKHVYCMYNYDPRSLRMDVTVPYSTTVPNTLNGWQLQSVAFGQLTGLYPYLPQEMIYFTF
jgi:hypothetical protein